MADLFEKCLKNAEPTRTKMDSNMMKIRHLDVQYQIKESEANQKLQSLVNSWKKMNKEEQRRNYEDVEACYAEAKKLCQMKISIASETYELVDGFIQKLDNDTSKFNTYMLHKHMAEGNSSAGASSQNKAGLEPASATRKRRGTAPSSTMSSMKKGSASRRRNTGATQLDEEDMDMDSGMATVVNTHGDMPIDPNEPRYCICQQVSFGNMVGCDNKNCPLEWFHFSCVGLSASPKGKWYCPQCRENKDVKKQQRNSKTPKNRGKSVQQD